MGRPGDLELDYPTNKTDAPLALSPIERVHMAEVRLAIVAAEAGNRALSLFSVDQLQENEKVIRRVGELLLLSSRIFKRQQRDALIWRLDESLGPGTAKENAREVLSRIPLTMYEVLSALDEGDSRAHAAARFGLSEEYVSANMRKIYELLEVNQPGAALAALETLIEAEGHERPPEPSLELEDPREQLDETLRQLSDTELDILGCACLGLPNKQIAAARVVTEQTIKFHLTHVYAKLGVKNRTAAAAIATRCGLIEWAVVLQGESRLMPATRKVSLERARQDA
ncbi:MAG TPA: LuxR C-terminal-related transcriptional regulator [Candidatus Saccharimonadales bacterium]|nr:LuxR C-terminal-related transcriptional regulator [Candidatus Saccharimonadales bacterium]